MPHRPSQDFVPGDPPLPGRLSGFRDGSSVVYRGRGGPPFRNKMTENFSPRIHAIFGSISLRSPEILIYIASLRPPPTHFDESFRLIDSKTHKIRHFSHLFTEIRPLNPTSPSFGPFIVLMHGYRPKTPYSASTHLDSSSRMG